MKKIFFVAVFLFFSLPIFSEGGIDEGLLYGTMFNLRYGFYKDQTLTVNFFDLYFLYYPDDETPIKPMPSEETESDNPKEKYFRISRMLGFVGFPITYNFSKNITEFGPGGVRAGLCFFGANGNVKFVFPVYAELDLLNAVYDEEHYFFNPQVTMVAECHFRFGKYVNFGLGVDGKISIFNAISAASDGEDSIKEGLRGEIGVFRPEVFVSVWLLFE